MSVFVNPLQFDRADDLERYPRALDADVEVCGRLGVDLMAAEQGGFGLDLTDIPWGCDYYLQTGRMMDADGVTQLMAPVVSWLLFRTTRGFELRATGFSSTVARGAGMRPGRTTMLAMSISGGLIGMGSAFFGLGPAGGFSGGPPYDLGYVAIALTLLAGSRPGGVVLAALFYGALTTGAKNMGR